MRDKNVRIYDVEFVKPRQADNKYPSAIFSLQLPKKTSHASVVTEIATIDVVKKIEEL